MFGSKLLFDFSSKSMLIFFVIVLFVVLIRTYLTNKEGFDDITNSSLAKSVESATNTVPVDNTQQTTTKDSSVPTRTDIVPEVSISGTGYDAMSLQQRAELLKDIQKVVRNEILANRSTTPILNEVEHKKETNSTAQGKDYTQTCYNDTEYRCPKNPDGSCPPIPDMSQYIKKDAIPCYGCSLDY
jgi:hypothetical protein